MVGIYFRTNRMPVRFLVYVAITALTRLLIGEAGKHGVDHMDMMWIAISTLLLALALLIPLRILPLSIAALGSRIEAEIGGNLRGLPAQKTSAVQFLAAMFARQGVEYAVDEGRLVAAFVEGTGHVDIFGDGHAGRDVRSAQKLGGAGCPVCAEARNRRRAVSLSRWHPAAAVSISPSGGD